MGGIVSLYCTYLGPRKHEVAVDDVALDSMENRIIESAYFMSTCSGDAAKNGRRESKKLRELKDKIQENTGLDASDVYKRYVSSIFNGAPFDFDGLVLQDKWFMTFVNDTKYKLGKYFNTWWFEACQGVFPAGFGPLEKKVADLLEDFILYGKIWIILERDDKMQLEDHLVLFYASCVMLHANDRFDTPFAKALYEKIKESIRLRARVVYSRKTKGEEDEEEEPKDYVACSILRHQLTHKYPHEVEAIFAANNGKVIDVPIRADVFPNNKRDANLLPDDENIQYLITYGVFNPPLKSKPHDKSILPYYELMLNWSHIEFPFNDDISPPSLDKSMGNRVLDHNNVLYEIKDGQIAQNHQKAASLAQKQRRQNESLRRWAASANPHVIQDVRVVQDGQDGQVIQDGRVVQDAQGDQVDQAGQDGQVIHAHSHGGRSRRYRRRYYRRKSCTVRRRKRPKIHQRRRVWRFR